MPNSEGTRTHNGDKKLGAPLACSHGALVSSLEGCKAPCPPNIVLTTQLSLDTGKSLQLLRGPDPGRRLGALGSKPGCMAWKDHFPVNISTNCRKHQPTAEKHRGSPGFTATIQGGLPLLAVCLSLPDPTAPTPYSWSLFPSLSWKQPEQKPTPPPSCCSLPHPVPRAQGLPGDPVNN